MRFVLFICCFLFSASMRALPCENISDFLYRELVVVENCSCFVREHPGPTLTAETARRNRIKRMSWQNWYYQSQITFDSLGRVVAMYGGQEHLFCGYDSLMYSKGFSRVDTINRYEFHESVWNYEWIGEADFDYDSLGRVAMINYDNYLPYFVWKWQSPYQQPLTVNISYRENLFFETADIFAGEEHRIYQYNKFDRTISLRITGGKFQDSSSIAARLNQSTDARGWFLSMEYFSVDSVNHWWTPKDNESMSIRRNKNGQLEAAWTANEMFTYEYDEGRLPQRIIAQCTEDPRVFTIEKYKYDYYK